MHPLLHDIRAFVQGERLFTASDRLLLAISGGLDSVVLAHLLQAMGYHFGLAHINFQLRSEESDADARFVAQLAQALKVPYHHTQFDTPAYQQQHGLGTQEAARKLRYTWLEDIRQREQYDYLLTAHHLDDNVETLLLQLLRGCGPVGIAGMRPKNGYICRPLLECSRQALEEYAHEQQLNWREDSSNAKDDYRRNYLRHHVLPHLQELQGAWSEVMRNNFRHLRQGRTLYQESLLRYWQQALNEEGHIEKARLPEDPFLAHSLLSAQLAPYGFTPDQCRQLLEARSGSQIRAQQQPWQIAAPTATQIRLYLRESASESPQQQSIEKLPISLAMSEGQKLDITTTSRPLQFATNPQIAYISTAAPLPFLLRPWQAGDRFQPLGMGGKHKKIQDFLTDLQLDPVQKAQVQLLTDAEGHILWVVGYRLAEEAKLKPEEEKCYLCRLSERSANPKVSRPRMSIDTAEDE